MQRRAKKTFVPHSRLVAVFVLLGLSLPFLSLSDTQDLFLSPTPLLFHL